jgi:hypothetical protein
MARKKKETEFSLELFRRPGDDQLRIRCTWDTHENEAEFKFPQPAKVQKKGLDQEQAENRGEALFDALFPGPIAEELAEARQKYPALRVRLSIPSKLAGRERLEKIAWESAYDTQTDEFLGLSRNLAFVRDIGRRIETFKLSGNPRVRILVVAASPEDCHPVSWDEEVGAICRAWGPQAEVIELPHASFEDFCWRMQAQPKERRFHIVHFIGHAGVAKRSQSVFVFEKKRQSEYVTGAQLASHLEGIPELRLVVLSACKTAAPSKDWEHDPSRSIAYALLRRGIPAVVGTRTNVADAVGPKFAAAFYNSLLKGNDLETAAAQARRKVAARRVVRGSDYEWATPVVYSQLDGGPLLEFSSAVDDEPTCLAITSTAGSEQAWPTCPHLDLSKAFDGRQLAKGQDWQQLYHRIGDFLRRRLNSERETELRLDAFLSLAFAAGYVLGTTWPPLSIFQRQPGVGETRWKPSPRPQWGDRPRWNFEEVGGRSSSDLVVAATTINPILSAVASAWEELGSSPAIFLSATLDQTGHRSMADADHAFLLASELVARIEELGSGRKVHFFLSGPASFALYLGQLSGQLGGIQLYHFDPELPPLYSPSILVRPKDRLASLPRPPVVPKVEPQRRARRPRTR